MVQHRTKPHQGSGRRRRSSYSDGVPGESELAQARIARRFSQDSEAGDDSRSSKALGAESNDLRRKRFKLYLATSWVGFFLDAVNGVFSVASVILVIVNFYYPSVVILDVLDLMVCCFFMWDYALRLYLADSRFQQFMEMQSLVDLLTVLPTFATYHLNLDQLNAYSMPTYLYFAQQFCLYYIRLLRLMRLRRLISYWDSEGTREIALTILSLFNALVFLAAALYSVENYFRREMFVGTLEYHDYFYFLVVTLSTVGYGEISMVTVPGKMLVAGSICLALFYIPKSTNRILRNLGGRSIYTTKVYYPSSTMSHVLVTGYIDEVSARDFLKEIFHSDHGNSNLHVVFLVQGQPSSALLALLEGPEYRSLTTYLNGSPLNDKDLKRAAAAAASACFILTNKYSTRSPKQDAVSILKALSVKRYVLREASMDLLVCVQFIRPESKHLYAISRASIPCTLTDQVISIEQIKMDIFAKSCLCPGFNTVVSNLIGSMEEEDEDEPQESLSVGDITFEEDEEELSILEAKRVITGKLNTRRIISGKLASSPLASKGLGLFVGSLSPKVAPGPFYGKHRLSNATGMQRQWLEEYKRGSSYEIYRTKLHPVFRGTPFTDLVEVAYRRLGVLIFALDMQAPISGRQRVILNPGPMLIPDTTERMVHAFVIARDETEADFSFESTVANVQATQLMLRELRSRRNQLNRTENSNAKAAEHRPGHPSKDRKASKERGAGYWSAFKSDLHGKPEEIEPTQDKEHLHMTTTSTSLSKATIRTSVEQELPSLRDHIVVVGPLDNVTAFVRTLRSKHLFSITPIVILASSPPSSKLWSSVSRFPLLFYVQGNPFEERDLIRAGIKVARCAVIAATMPHGEDGSNRKSMLRDANGILARQTILRLNPGMSLVVEVSNSANLGLLSELRSNHRDKVAVASQELDLAVQKRIDDVDCILHVLELQKAKRDHLESNNLAALASGAVFTASTLDVLLCQSFFNPHLLGVLQILISGTDFPHLQSLKDELVEELGSFEESNLYQVAVPREFVGRAYGKLLKFLVLRNAAVPLGLYRCVLPPKPHHARSSFSASSGGGFLRRYVFTNPTSDTILRADDLVYVLSPHPPTEDRVDMTEAILREAECKEAVAGAAGQVVLGGELLSATQVTTVKSRLDAELARAERDIRRLQRAKLKIEAIEAKAIHARLSATDLSSVPTIAEDVEHKLPHDEGSSFKPHARVANLESALRIMPITIQMGAGLAPGPEQSALGSDATEAHGNDTMEKGIIPQQPVVRDEELE